MTRKSMDNDSTSSIDRDNVMNLLTTSVNRAISDIGNPDLSVLLMGDVHLTKYKSSTSKLDIRKLDNKMSLFVNTRNKPCYFYMDFDIAYKKDDFSSTVCYLNSLGYYAIYSGSVNNGEAIICNSIDKSYDTIKKVLTGFIKDKVKPNKVVENNANKSNSTPVDGELDVLMEKILDNTPNEPVNRLDTYKDNGAVLISALEPIETCEIVDEDIKGVVYYHKKFGMAYDKETKTYRRINKYAYTQDQLDKIMLRPEDFKYIVVGRKNFVGKCGGKNGGIEYRHMAIWGEKLPDGSVGIRCPELSDKLMNKQEFIRNLLTAEIRHINRIFTLNRIKQAFKIDTISDCTVTLKNGATIDYDKYRYISTVDYDSRERDKLKIVSLKDLIKSIYSYALYLVALDKLGKTELVKSAFKDNIPKMCNFNKCIATVIDNVTLENSSPIWKLNVLAPKDNSDAIESTYIFIKIIEDKLMVYRDKNKKTMEFSKFANKFRVAFKLD